MYVSVVTAFWQLVFLQSAQEIELHALFARHYEARHYSALRVTWLCTSQACISSLHEKELWKDFFSLIHCVVLELSLLPSQNVS